MAIKSTHSHGSQEVWGEIFDQIDVSYSEKYENQGKLFELVKIEFLEEIFPKPPVKILEVGSGTGFVSLYFAKRGYRTTLLDTNKKVLGIAKRNFQKEGVTGEFIVGDAESLPFKDKQFDIVTSFGLLEHFNDPRVAVNEMSRVLKPNGLFFADVVPERFSVQKFGDLLNSLSSVLYWWSKGKLFSRLKSKVKRNFKPVYFENTLKVKDYEKIILDSGVTSVKLRGNRPFPRLSLPKFLDKAYTVSLKPLLPLWRNFDRSGSGISLFWGAGWWIYGFKK